MTAEDVKNVIIKNSMIWYDKSNQLNLIAVRTGVNATNTFDDVLYCVFKDSKNSLKMFQYSVTTESGFHYLKNPIRSIGTAIVVPNHQYIDSHSIGLHKGQYKALVQTGKLLVYRDNNKDTKLDYTESTIETSENDGINIHRSKENGTSLLVDKWSAACTVFANYREFSSFMPLCDIHSKFYGNKFTYTLFQKDKFDKILNQK